MTSFVYLKSVHKNCAVGRFLLSRVFVQENKEKKENNPPPPGVLLFCIFHTHSSNEDNCEFLQLLFLQIGFRNLEKQEHFVVLTYAESPDLTSLASAKKATTNADSWWGRGSYKP